MKHSIYRTGIVSMAIMILSINNVRAQNETNSVAVKNLTLNEAIRLSLQNNKMLKLSHFKAEEATANYHEMKSNRLPDVKVSGSYLRLNSPDVDLKIKLGSGSGSQGGSMKVDQLGYGMANVAMPIFSGFRLKYGLEAAKYLEMAAKLDVENDKEEVIQNTINAYSNLYKSIKTIELVKENLRQQDTRITDFTNLEKNGVIARNDLMKSQLQQSNVELTLLDAENNYNITCINMSLMLGLPEGTKLMADSEYFKDQNFNGSIVQWEETALKNRKDVSALEYREKAANSGIKSTKGEYYPSLAVTGGYIAADIPNLLTVTNALNVGLGLQYNFASLWKTGAKLEVAQARLHQLQTSQTMLADQLHIQVSQAYQNYVLSLKKIDVYAKSVDQANENYRITKNKHVNNLVTTTDLLDADLAQLQAHLNYTFAKADAMVAFKKLQQAAGTLFNEYNTIK